MNKIKVIDLLVKIANGEEVPKKIKFDGNVFEYTGTRIVNEDSDDLIDYLSYDFSNLNDEIEIIEDKIEKLNINDNGYLVESPSVFEIVNKINELIDKLNEGKDE